MEFRHRVRVAATELRGKMPVKLALTKVKGVGPAIANAILTILKIDPKKQMGTFNDEELAALEEFVKNPQGIPSWSVNRQKDPFTGKDEHLVSSDLDFRLKTDIDYMKKTKSYRGMRHAFGLKVRGQRTKSTGRRGKSLGVRRKKGVKQ
ncbi:MAG: 30S ribosomal protein S13 [Candidatus Altiarchaeota archaeon]|nr:30S ribosomal protein S13 [Candidatus Altiarchaeota archaeon]